MSTARRAWGALGIRGKQFVVTLALMLVAGIAGGGVAEQRVSAEAQRRIERELDRLAQTSAVAVAQLSPDASPEAISRVVDALGAATSARITLVRQDGTVIADSRVDGDIRGLDNHASRPEVREARDFGQGLSRRHSVTLHDDLLYLARPATVAGAPAIMRVALPLDAVAEAVSTFRLFFGIGALVFVLVAIVGGGLASQLVHRRLSALIAHARDLRTSMGSSMAYSGHDDEDDDVATLTRTFDDLTRSLERQLARLVDERNRVDGLLQAMGEGVVALNSEAQVQVCNPAAQRMLGAPVDATTLQALSDRPAVQRAAQEALAGNAASAEVELADGDRVQRVLLHATPTPGGAILVLHDVTEVRRLENLRRDFVANVSHELRTPCSVILANTETLLSGALQEGPHAQKFVEAIHRNGERLSRLIADLLELSRIEAGKVVFTRVPIDLGAAVATVVDAMEQPALDKQQSLTVDVEDGLALEGDPRAMDQVLLNLVDNAVKYTPAGGRVHIAARGDGDTITLMVEDDGPGVDAKHRDRLFERFYRVDPGRSRDVGGTGLGLAIVKHLVEAMDGAIRVEDGSPRGTRFIVELPREPATTERLANMLP